jgi:glycosyltransferase involved in cell wall biosynthesis
MLHTSFSTLSIVIPAYNEGKTVHLIFDKVKQVQLPGGIRKEVIIVNDCSKDDTEAAILRYQAGSTRRARRSTGRTASGPSTAS